MNLRLVIGVVAFLSLAPVKGFGAASVPCPLASSDLARALFQVFATCYPPTPEIPSQIFASDATAAQAFAKAGGFPNTNSPDDILLMSTNSGATSTTATGPIYYENVYINSTTPLALARTTDE